MPLAIFDLDNTLVDRAASFLRWATQFAAVHGLEPADVTWLVDADGDGLVPRSLLLAGIRERFSVELPLNAYQAQIVELVELDPAVAVALDGLRAAGWRVAIATNGQTHQQSAKIRRAGLDAHGVDASWTRVGPSLPHAGSGRRRPLGRRGSCQIGPAFVNHLTATRACERLQLTTISISNPWGFSRNSAV